MERSRIIGNIGNWGREWRTLEENEELRERQGIVEAGEIQKEH